MTENAPFPNQSVLPRRSDLESHRFLEEMAQDDGVSRKQFWLAWACALATAAGVAVVWFLL
jgi:hypothetical protein